jgi:hypothetical protein
MSEPAVTTDKPVRVLAFRAPDGCWRAWLDSEPDVCVSDRTARAAAMQLVRADPGLDPASLEVVERSGGSGFVVFAVSRSESAPCPDCGGSGRYVGLAVVEACRACRGTGQAR